MTPAAGWVLVALVGVLFGAAIPALLQLRKTLKAAEETLETTGSHVNEALNQLSITLERVNRAADQLEGGMKQATSVFTTLGSVAETLVKVRGAVGTVASIGSIVSAAFLAAIGLRPRDKGEKVERAEPEEEQEPVR